MPNEFRRWKHEIYVNIVTRCLRPTFTSTEDVDYAVWNGHLTRISYRIIIYNIHLISGVGFSIWKAFFDVDKWYFLVTEYVAIYEYFGLSENQFSISKTICHFPMPCIRLSNKCFVIFTVNTDIIFFARNLKKFIRRNMGLRIYFWRNLGDFWNKSIRNGKLRFFHHVYCHKCSS